MRENSWTPPKSLIFSAQPNTLSYHFLPTFLSLFFIPQFSAQLNTFLIKRDNFISYQPVPPAYIHTLWYFRQYPHFMLHVSTIYAVIFFKVNYPHFMLHVLKSVKKCKSKTIKALSKFDLIKQSVIKSLAGLETLSHFTPWNVPFL